MEIILLSPKYKQKEMTKLSTTPNILGVDFLRQSSIVTIDQLNSYPLIVIGAGGIGSPLVLAASKMGIFNISVFDDDTVDNHNLPNQFYRICDVGKTKVMALSEIVMDFAGITIDAHPELYVSQDLSGIVVSAVDSMESRKAIWKKVKFNPRVAMYIEARMGGQMFRVFTLNPSNPDSIAKYEATLHDDSEAEPIRCTERAIIYNVFMTAAFICNQIKKFCKGEERVFDFTFDMVNLDIFIPN